MTPGAAVVTGVAGGIGSATAVALYQQGWRVIGVDWDKPATDLPLEALHLVDLSDAESTVAVFREIAETEGLAALVNNAGMPMDKAFLDVTVEEWDLTMHVNVRASFLAIQRLASSLAKTRGAVVNVASVHALATSPGASVYAASKGALVALTRAAAIELGPLGVRVNAILPGATDTQMLRQGLSRQGDNFDKDAAIAALARRTPLQAIAAPADIAEGIVFLADGTRSGFMTGQTLVIDGGATARLSTE